MISALCAGFSCLVMSQAKPSPVSPADHLQAIYAHANNLKLKKDVPALEALYKENHTPDYQFFGKSGRTTLPDLIKGMKAAMDHIATVSKATSKIEKYTKTAEGAIVTVRTVFVFVTKPMDDHHAHVISEQILGKDRWVHRAGKWQVVMSKTLSENFLRDGRPVR